MKDELNGWSQFFLICAIIGLGWSFTGSVLLVFVPSSEAAFKLFGSLSFTGICVLLAWVIEECRSV